MSVGMARLDELELPDDEALRNLILTEDLLVEEVEPVSYQMTCIRRFRSCWTAVLTNYLPSCEPTANRNPDDWVISCISICYDFMMKKWPGWSE
jgi:hypothetical protein